MAFSAIYPFARTQVWLAYEWEPGKAHKVKARLGDVCVLRQGRDCRVFAEYAEETLTAMQVVEHLSSTRRILQICRECYNHPSFVESGPLERSDHPAICTQTPRLHGSDEDSTHLPSSVQERPVRSGLAASLRPILSPDLPGYQAENSTVVQDQECIAGGH